MSQAGALLPNGYPYSNPLPEWLDYAQNLVLKQGKATLIFVDGGLGEGKSSMAAQMVRQLDPGLDGSKESYLLRYHLGGQALLNNFNKAYEAGCKAVIFDESGIDMNSRRAMSGMNMRLLELFQIYRAYKIVVIMVLPTIKIIDSQIFDYGIHRFTVNVHSLKRGEYNRFTVFDREASIHLYHNLKKYRDIRRAYRTPFSNFDGMCKPLPLEHQKVLDSLGMEAKKDRTSKLQTPEGVTLKEVCGLLELTPEVLSRQIAKNGIRTHKSPEDKRVKYISQDDYDRLRIALGGGETI